MKFIKDYKGWNFTIGDVDSNVFMIKSRFIRNTQTLRLLLDLNHEWKPNGYIKFDIYRAGDFGCTIYWHN